MFPLPVNLHILSPPNFSYGTEFEHIQQMCVALEWWDTRTHRNSGASSLQLAYETQTVILPPTLAPAFEITAAVFPTPLLLIHVLPIPKPWHIFEIQLLTEVICNMHKSIIFNPDFTFFFSLPI